MNRLYATLPYPFALGLSKGSTLPPSFPRRRESRPSRPKQVAS